MTSDGQGFHYGVAGKVHDVHGTVGLVGGVGAAAVGQHGNAGGVMPDRNGKCRPKRRAVISEYIEAHVNETDRATIVVGHDELLGGGNVLSVDGSCNRRHIRSGQAGRGGERQAGVASDELAILVGEGCALRREYCSGC